MKNLQDYEETVVYLFLFTVTILLIVASAAGIVALLLWLQGVPCL